MLTTTLVGIVAPKPQRQLRKHQEVEQKKKLHSPKCTQCKEEKDTFHVSMWKNVDVVRLCSEKCLKAFNQDWEAMKNKKKEMKECALNAK